MSKELYLKLTIDFLKVVASAVLTNIAVNLISTFIAEIVLCFVPGVSISASAAICFATTYLAGKMYLEILLAFTKSGKRIEDATQEDFKQEIKKHTMTRDDLREAKATQQENESKK